MRERSLRSSVQTIIVQERLRLLWCTWPCRFACRKVANNGGRKCGFSLAQSGNNKLPETKTTHSHCSTPVLMLIQLIQCKCAFCWLWSTMYLKISTPWQTTRATTNNCFKSVKKRYKILEFNLEQCKMTVPSSRNKGHVLKCLVLLDQKSQTRRDQFIVIK